MVRSIAAVIVAVITWFLVATIGNRILRAAIPGYSAVEVSMAFTLTMMICRLVLGLVSSLCSGFACAAVAHNRVVPKVAAVIMLLLFLPDHYLVWAKFPIWYHLFFLVTLVPTMWIGAALKGDRDARSNIIFILADDGCPHE
jgi:hypothetical protein